MFSGPCLCICPLSRPTISWKPLSLTPYPEPPCHWWSHLPRQGTILSSFSSLALGVQWMLLLAQTPQDWDYFCSKSQGWISRAWLEFHKICKAFPVGNSILWHSRCVFWHLIWRTAQADKYLFPKCPKAVFHSNHMKSLIKRAGGFLSSILWVRRKDFSQPNLSKPIFRANILTLCKMQLAIPSVEQLETPWETWCWETILRSRF